jgi:hypothetical protein
MVTKIQLAAMSRANMALDDRRPFYLYVDEFQNFATDSFAVILSEARKYGLNLAIANQYVSQIDEVVRAAVFGNVGSMVTFRVGADDATFLSKYFAPQFEPTDLMALHNRYFISSMTINGEQSTPFSGSTLNQPPVQYDLTDKIVAISRERNCVPRNVIEDQIREAIMGQQPQNPASGAPQGQNQGHNQPKKPSVTDVIAQHLRQATIDSLGPPSQQHASRPQGERPQNATPMQQGSHNASNNQPADQAGKSKRTRTRRGKKTDDRNQTNTEQRRHEPAQQQTAPKLADGEQTIRLR